MDIDKIPATETILYKLCSGVYDQYKAQHERKFNQGLSKLHGDVEKYLNISIDETDSNITMTFTLYRSDIDAG